MTVNMTMLFRFFTASRIPDSTEKDGPALSGPMKSVPETLYPACSPLRDELNFPAIIPIIIGVMFWLRAYSSILSPR